MGLRIIYGKPGSGKSTYCFSEISELIDTQEKIYIITPEQFSFTAETKLMNVIEKNAVINAEVITLSRMAYRVLEETGGIKTTLSKCGKAMLIYSILSAYKKDLKFLGKTDENIETAMNAITEFKKHGISVSSLKKEMEETQDNYLKTKLSDMALIYEKFENQIKENYIDETDLLLLLSQELKNTNIVKDSIIFIDEFAGFTYPEYEVIKELIKQAKEVNITISADNLELNTNPDTDIFYSNKMTYKKLKKIAAENNLEMEEPIFLPEQYRFKTKELKHIAENLGKTKSTKLEQNVENLHLFLAKNQYNEIENVAKEIVKLVRDKNLRYKDIGIITKNLELYSSLTKAIFMKYEIPIFIDEKRDLNQNIIIQYVLAILEVLSKNFANDAIFNYMKLGFLNLQEDELFSFENYCLKWGIKRNKWKENFTYGVEQEGEKQVERYNEIRKQIVEPLVCLKENIGKQKTAINITKCLYEFLKEQQIEEKIADKMQALEENEMLELAKEYKDSYEIILNVLDEIVLVFGEDKLNLEQYKNILKTGLKNSGLGKIPGTQDQVIIGDVERSRSHKVDVVFIIGLNDGAFPSVRRDEGFFNDEDRETLKNDGLELAGGTIDNLYEENFNIYKAFTTAEKQIYLSYASSDSEGKSLRPSLYVNRIKRMFPKLEEKSDIIKKQYEIVNKDATYEELLENIAKIKKQEEINPIWYAVYEYFRKDENYKNRLEKDMLGVGYTNLPEDITKENIHKLYGNTLNTSVSRLEKYRSCPFSYYLQYGLNLKEKPELKVKSFDTGSFMHEVIDNFFEYVKEENIKLVDLEEDDIEKIVKDIIEENLKQTKNFIFTATPKYVVLVRRLQKIVTKAIKYLVQTLVNSEFNIAGTEIEFGKGKEHEPITLFLDDGKKVEITGKIDRMDVAKDENGKYLRIIDYKSSVKDIDFNEVYAGLQIQLLTYVDAICKKEDYIPAGAFYFPLLEQMIKSDKRCTEEEIEEQIRKNFRMKGIILADVKVIKMQDNSLESGSSKIVPAAITKEGSINEKWTKGGVDQEEFQILQNHIDKTIRQIAKEILDGKIDIKPYYKKGKTPCEYCSYKAICGFNPRQKDNKYFYIDQKSKDEVINKMKEK